LRRSRRWRDQVQEETSRLRDQFQQAGDRFEERLEGWLEDPDPEPFDDRYRDPEPRRPRPSEPPAEAWDDWDGWEDGGPEDPIEPPPHQGRRRRAPDNEDDPWV
jgi:hypothetical protein